jgi:membrane protease YdiL (CAAX protease family)
MAWIGVGLYTVWLNQFFMNRDKNAARIGGYACFALAGLWFVSDGVPVAALTGMGILFLALAKFRRAPSSPRNRTEAAPPLPEPARRALDRVLPTIAAFVRRADALLSDHERFESAVGGSDAAAFERWELSALRAAAYWIPVALLAMLAGTVLVAPFKLIAGGLGLASTPEGHWLLKQDWPRLVVRIAALSVLQQVYVMGAFAGLEAALRRQGLKKRDAAAGSAALVGAVLLAHLLYRGTPGMKAAPLLAIQLALIYSYARTRTLLIPSAANVALGIMSLYSARMVVLLTANLGSVDDLPGIPGLSGVLAVLGVSLALFAALAAVRGWNFLLAETSALGQWWSAPAETPKSPLALAPTGFLWGIGVYLAGYLTYYAVAWISPAGETVPAALKQVLLMPFDVLVYVFLIGAALEELIFRFGLFGALAKYLGDDDFGPRFWAAALGSAVVFSAFHFVDLSALVRFLGLNVSKLVQSLMVVYGFSWPGFLGRVAAGVVLAFLYRRSGVLLIPVVAHFTSNLLEAVGLRWGLPWFLAAIVGIFALQAYDGLVLCREAKNLTEEARRR